ncbi:Glutaredoxin, GrxC family [secondary endosymbiont of Heteropsylla cubana]|uniref:Glutaredoxin n=1 Tax=secondary endosymbiont of Heteropsylla cubana TaxID=134287 RepID=J3Z538_9ENTR|nr:glutaredoxin 3 [secondary endosymbiont of Heteropsylla cubana]AFP85404.1 Glutaredoxin, GrxC family [secondary endosymbiont of Heteropsylla cubana]
MANIKIYTKITCPFCHRAKELITSKKISFKEISIDGRSDLREEMIKISGQTTVPQIFINNKHIGGYDDLYALDINGQLDQLLTLPDLIGRPL